MIIAGSTGRGKSYLLIKMLLSFLAIDSRIHYVKKNGKLSPKVFKLAEKTIAAGDKAHIKTNHSFENRSTREHYPGKHRLDIIINGDTAHTVDFSLST